MTTPSRSLDISAISARALAAQSISPGPYTIQWVDRGEDEPAEERGVDYILDANGDRVVVGDSGVYPPHGPVAAHIAGCDPTTVLALTGRIEELEAIVESRDEDDARRQRGEPTYAEAAMAVRLSDALARIAALEAGLVEAAGTIESWVKSWTEYPDHTQDPDWPMAQRLRNLATNTESKEGK